MNEQKFSIIIPHHNIPNLLLRCLHSIPMRNEVQVIVVDDGSNAECVVQCKNIEKTFPNVEFYYSTPAHGGGFARNLGLQKAMGEYVLFADADDYFNPCLNEVLDEYRNCDKDVVFFNANSLDTDNYTFCHRCWQVNYYTDLYRKDKDKALFGCRYRFGEPWCKLVKRNVLTENRIHFDESIIHNDTTFSYLVGYFSKSFAVDGRALYCVTHRSGSVSKQVSVERWLIRTEVFAKANLFFKSHSVNISDERAYRGMFHFLLKCDFLNVRKCITTIKSLGTSEWDIVRSIICFPWKILKKVVSEKYIKHQLKNKIQ